MINWKKILFGCDTKYDRLHWWHPVAWILAIFGIVATVFILLLEWRSPKEHWSLFKEIFVKHNV